MSDLISRQAAIDALGERPMLSGDCEWEIAARKQYDDDRAAIENVPSAQPERKTGRWEMGRCSVCGGHAPFWCMATTYYESNYCPNCGAYMRGETDG